MKGAEKQAISNALARFKTGETEVWITIGGVRYRLGPPDPDTFEGGDVLLAVNRGYEVVTLFKRKGPHVGIDRWQVGSMATLGPLWTSKKKIRARILGAYVRDREKAEGKRRRDEETYVRKLRGARTRR